MSDPETPRLEAVEDELYGVAPEDFVRRRSELVRAAKQRGDRELADAIAAARKPTVAASALNSFARDDDASIDALLEIGERLRDAVDRAVGDEIRDLMRERARAVSDLMGEVRRHAEARGEPLSTSVANQVERSLRAAMASEEHARTVRRGVLATALDEPGLGEFGARARPEPDRRDADRRTAPSRAGRQPSQAAARRATAAQAAADGAEAALAMATARRAAIVDEQHAARRRLDELDQQVRIAREQEAEADERLRQAQRELRSARRTAE